MMNNEQKLDFQPLLMDGSNLNLWLKSLEFNLLAKSKAVKNSAFKDGWNFSTVNPDTTPEEKRVQQKVIDEEEETAAKAINTILTHMDPKLRIQFLMDCDPNPRIFLTKIKDLFHVTSASNVRNVRARFNDLKLRDFPTIRLYNQRLQELAAEMRKVGAKDDVTDAKLLQKSFETMNFAQTNVFVSQTFDSYDKFFKTVDDWETSLSMLKQRKINGDTVLSITNSKGKGRPNSNKPFGTNKKNKISKPKHKSNVPSKMDKPANPNRIVVCFACRSRDHVMRDCPEYKERYDYLQELKRQASNSSSHLEVTS